LTYTALKNKVHKMFQVQVKFKLCLHWRNLLRGRGQISQLKHIYIGKVLPPKMWQ